LREEASSLANSFYQVKKSLGQRGNALAQWQGHWNGIFEVSGSTMTDQPGKCHHFVIGAVTFCPLTRGTGFQSSGRGIKSVNSGWNKLPVFV